MDRASLESPEPFRTWNALGLRHIFAPGHALEPKKREPVATVREGAPPAQLIQAMMAKVRMRLAPPHAHIWTYWELPLDLGGHPDNARRTLWQNMLKAMALPRGSVLFWPMSYAQGKTLAPDPGLFWQGMRESGAPYMICFGRRAHEHLFPGRDFKPEPFEFQGRTVLTLPGPDDMLPDNRSVKQLVWRALASLKPPNRTAPREHR